MNKLFLSMLACIATSLVFTSCDKEDGDENNDGNLESSPVTVVEAKIENGDRYNGQIDSVKAFINWKEIYNEETQNWEEVGYEVGFGVYQNGGFTLSLVNPLDDEQLSEIKDLDFLENILDPEYSEAWKNIQVSAPGARGACFEDIDAFDSSGNIIGKFELGTWDDDADIDVETQFMYMDRDVTITGSYSEKDGDETQNYIYTVSLKRGWNLLYEVDTEKGNTFTQEITTRKPSGLTWDYRDYSRY
ncbi:MAG: hypothetical protein LBC40_04520 [Dysgonamonadaceae bacterium]|jgi:hypothetical protein|nr:hypothetical protein [Dysgonamonadaceae bacterium]